MLLRRPGTIAQSPSSCSRAKQSFFPDALTSGVAPLNGTAGAEFDGAAVSTFVGWSVAAGDVNGDGIADIITGGEYATVGGNFNVGSAYVIFGHKQSINNHWPTAAVNLGGL